MSENYKIIAYFLQYPSVDSTLSNLSYWVFLGSCNARDLYCGGNSFEIRPVCWHFKGCNFHPRECLARYTSPHTCIYVCYVTDLFSSKAHLP